MRADDLLREDHDEIRALLHQLEASGPDEPARRSELMDELVAVLDVHVQIENDLYYPAVRDASPLYAVAHAEHRQIDEQLAVVLRTDPAGETFAAEVAMLANTVDHHAGEEEREMFPQAEAIGVPALEALGAEMRARQQHLQASAVTRARLRVKGAVLRHL